MILCCKNLGWMFRAKRYMRIIFSIATNIYSYFYHSVLSRKAVNFDWLGGWNVPHWGVLSLIVFLSIGCSLLITEKLYYRNYYLFAEHSIKLMQQNILCLSNTIQHLVGTGRIHSTVNEACGHQDGVENENSRNKTWMACFERVKVLRLEQHIPERIKASNVKRYLHT